MNKPAFIVEGHLEQDFVQAICPGAPVRRIGCNGTDVKIDAVAKHVATHARLLQKRYAPIIVIFDRERREESCESLEKMLICELEKHGVEAKIIVGIPDRNIESWILADFPTFAATIGIDSAKAEVFEGKACKRKIQELVGEKLYYNEVAHGVKWLIKAKPHNMVKNSPSFARLCNSLKDLGCPWLQQEKPLFDE